MGVQRAHDADVDLGRRGRVQRAVGGGDLLGVGDALLGLLDEGRPLVERAHEQRRPQVLQARGERAVVVLGLDRLGLHEADRPGVEPRREAHDRHPGLLVAGHDRPLDGRRPAPARQQRRMDVEDLEVRQQRLLDERAEGAHDDDLRARRGHALARLGRVDRLRLPQLQAEVAGGARHRRRRELAPAPGGAVGPGDHQRRAVVALREALQDRGREGRRAEEGGPQAASRRSRRVRMASLRWSRDVRSRMRIPSRWSISCWMTRASRPVASIEDRLAARRPARGPGRGSGARRRRGRRAGSGSPPPSSPCRRRTTRAPG